MVHLRTGSFSAQIIRRILHTGKKINSEGLATWLDQGTPWSYFKVEEMKYNLDSAEYILRAGIKRSIPKGL
jgi:hypothetical protein